MLFLKEHIGTPPSTFVSFTLHPGSVIAAEFNIFRTRAMRLALAFALPVALAFDFSAFFQGRGNTSDDEASSTGGGKACAGYLCDYPHGPCVAKPADCKCREPTLKCVHGPGNAWSCLASNEACKKLRAGLNM